MEINVKDVTKMYWKHAALKDISFTLSGSKIVGLLGRNGAGKTTFMNMLAGLQTPTEGSIEVNGQNPFDNRHITKDICMIKEGDNFQKDMRVKDILKSYSIFYENWDQALADELVALYNLPIKKRIRKYSKGMASAVGIIVGLASNAPITIFDEPYIGLDAVGRKRFYDILLEQYEENERMIIFSTHLIDEVSLLFEEVLIVQEGKLTVHEEAEKLRNYAYTISGNKEQVENYIQTKKVLHQNEVANMKSATVIGNKEEAKQAGFQPEGVPIQDIMVYLTETDKGGWA